MTHPIRKAEIHTFQRNSHSGKGSRWLAQFHPYSVYPIFFRGASEQEVIDAAETLRAEAIEKHEASCIARQERKEKAAEARRKKKGTA